MVLHKRMLAVLALTFLFIGCAPQIVMKSNPKSIEEFNRVSAKRSGGKIFLYSGDSLEFEEIRIDGNSVELLNGTKQRDWMPFDSVNYVYLNDGPVQSCMMGLSLGFVLGFVGVLGAERIVNPVEDTASQVTPHWTPAASKIGLITGVAGAILAISVGTSSMSNFISE